VEKEGIGEVNKTVLGTIIGTALLGLAKAKMGGRNEYKPRKIEDIYNLSAQEKAQITELHLSDRGLTHLPDDIFDGFTNLKELYSSGNELTKIPDSIGNLTNLKILWLNRNELTKLPDSIGNLTNLEILWLDQNELTKLPDSIGNLTNLEILWLDENPWQKPVPKETILKMIINRVNKDIIEKIIDMNNSIPTKSKSNLRIR